MLPLWKALPAPLAGASPLSTLTPRPRSPEVPRPLPGPGAPGADGWGGGWMWAGYSPGFLRLALASSSVMGLPRARPLALPVD